VSINIRWFFTTLRPASQHATCASACQRLDRHSCHSSMIAAVVQLGVDDESTTTQGRRRRWCYSPSLHWFRPTQIRNGPRPLPVFHNKYFFSFCFGVSALQIVLVLSSAQHQWKGVFLFLLKIVKTDLRNCIDDGFVNDCHLFQGIRISRCNFKWQYHSLFF